MNPLEAGKRIRESGDPGSELSIERLSSSSSAFTSAHLDRFEKTGWGVGGRSRGKAEGAPFQDRFFNAASRAPRS